MNHRQEWLLNALLFLMIAVVFASGFYQSPGLLDGWHRFNYFWYMTTTGISLVAMGRIIWRSGGVPDFSLKDPWFWSAVAVFLPAALLRLSYTWDISIWLDEYVQVANTATTFKESAVQQQPPFYYLFSTAIVDLIGWTEAWLRSPSLVFGSGSILLGGILGRLMGFGKGLYLVWLLFLAFTPILIRYSFEGRPNIAGVFVSLLWIGTLIPPIKKQKLDFADGLRIFTGTFIFCLTIGLQSLALPLYSMPMLFAAGVLLKVRREFVKIAITQALALLVFGPILYGIIFESIAHNQFQEDWMTRFIGLQSFQWVDYGVRLLGMIPFFEFLAGAGMLALVVLFRKRQADVWASGLLFAGVLLLPFVFSAIFQVTINWLFYDRYFLCYVVVFLLAVFHILNRCGDQLPRWKPGSSIFVSLAFLVSVGGAYKIKAEAQISNMYNYGGDFRSIYDYINENTGDSNLIAHFTVLSQKIFEPRTLLAPEFYLKKKQGADFFYRRFRDSVGSDGDQVLDIVRTLKKQKITDLFLAIGPFTLFDDQHFYQLEELPQLKVLKFKDYEILHIRSDGQPMMSLFKDYIVRWLESEPEEGYLFKLKETLFYILVFTRELDSAEELLLELEKMSREMDPSGFRDEKMHLMRQVFSGHSR